MTQIVKLGMGNTNQHGVLDHETLNYFAHEARLLSEIQQIDPDFTETGQNFVFKLYLTHGIDVEFGFSDLKEAREARRDFVLSMMKFWGPDQIVFAHGIDQEVTIVAAVAGITAIFDKENRFGFSLYIAGAPYPVNLIFLEKDIAEQARLSISEKLEDYLRCRAMAGNQISVAVNAR